MKVLPVRWVPIKSVGIMSGNKMLFAKRNNVINKGIFFSLTYSALPYYTAKVIQLRFSLFFESPAAAVVDLNPNGRKNLCQMKIQVVTFKVTVKPSYSLKSSKYIYTIKRPVVILLEWSKNSSMAYHTMMSLLKKIDTF